MNNSTNLHLLTIIFEPKQDLNSLSPELLESTINAIKAEKRSSTNNEQFFLLDGFQKQYEQRLKEQLNN